MALLAIFVVRICIGGTVGLLYLVAVFVVRMCKGGTAVNSGPALLSSHICCKDVQRWHCCT